MSYVLLWDDPWADQRADVLLMGRPIVGRPTGRPVGSMSPLGGIMGHPFVVPWDIYPMREMGFDLWVTHGTIRRTSYP